MPHPSAPFTGVLNVVRPLPSSLCLQVVLTSKIGTPPFHFFQELHPLIEVIQPASSISSKPTPYIPHDALSSYSLQGHLEFFLCDTSDLDDPEGRVTQGCFNMHPLDRAMETRRRSTPISQEDTSLIPPAGLGKPTRRSCLEPSPAT